MKVSLHPIRPGGKKTRRLRGCWVCKQIFFATSAELKEHAEDHDRKIARSRLIAYDPNHPYAPKTIGGIYLP